VAIANPVPASEPALSQTIEEEEVLGSVFETLLATDGEGSLVPGLAEGGSSSTKGAGRACACGRASPSPTVRP